MQCPSHSHVVKLLLPPVPSRLRSFPNTFSAAYQPDSCFPWLPFFAGGMAVRRISFLSPFPLQVPPIWPLRCAPFWSKACRNSAYVCFAWGRFPTGGHKSQLDGNISGQGTKRECAVLRGWVHTIGFIRGHFRFPEASLSRTRFFRF